MIGMTDDRLLIDRVGDEAEGFLGYQPAELLGRSILSLVDETHIPLLLGALAQAFATTRAVTTATVSVRTKQGKVRRCEAIVVPLDPAPASAFALFPEEPDVARSLTDVQRLLRRFGDRIAAIDVQSLTSIPSEAEIPGVDQLTTRESEIVRMLVAGDRVPTIAATLFLSQSTIRNQLSSVYRKLGVRSQQKLVDLFRASEGRSSRDPAKTKR
jgi:PAS domain S-box-containing protein